MSLSDSLRLSADAARSAISALWNPFTVSIRERSWSGQRSGLGVKTDLDTPLRVGANPPRVHQLTQRDAIASGGLYSTQDFEIIVTPDFLTGGFTASQLDPPPDGSPKEVLFLLTGPGIQGTAVFKKIGQDFSGVATYKITLRKTGEIVS